MFDGLSVFGDERKAPRDEKQKEDIIIPITKVKGWDMLTPMSKPIRRGNMEIITPKNKDANISPNMMVGM